MKRMRNLGSHQPASESCRRKYFRGRSPPLCVSFETRTRLWLEVFERPKNGMESTTIRSPHRDSPFDTNFVAR